TGIDQQEDDIGALDFLPAAFDADFLDFVLGFAQAGGVDDVQRNALDLDGRAQRVACRAGNRRDDGQIVASQAIEQRGLTDVRLAGQHDVEAALQQFALAGSVENLGQLELQALQATEGIGGLEEVDILVWKI